MYSYEVVLVIMKRIWNIMVFLVVVEGGVAGGAAKNVCSMAALGLNPALPIGVSYVSYYFPNQSLSVNLDPYIIII